MKKNVLYLLLYLCVCLFRVHLFVPVSFISFISIAQRDFKIT